MGKVTRLAGMALAASFALTVVFGGVAKAEHEHGRGGHHQFSQFHGGNGNNWRSNGNFGGWNGHDDDNDDDDNDDDEGHGRWNMSNGGGCGGNNFHQFNRGNHYGWRNQQGWNNAYNNGGVMPFTPAYNNVDPNGIVPFTSAYGNGYVDPNAAAYGYGYAGPNRFYPASAYGSGYPATNGGGLLSNLLGAAGLGNANGYVDPNAAAYGGYGYGYPATTGTGISGALGSLLNNLGGAQQQQLMGY